MNQPELVSFFNLFFPLILFSELLSLFFLFKKKTRNLVLCLLFQRVTCTVYFSSLKKNLFMSSFSGCTFLSSVQHFFSLPIFLNSLFDKRAKNIHFKKISIFSKSWKSGIEGGFFSRVEKIAIYQLKQRVDFIVSITPTSRTLKDFLRSFWGYKK